MRELFEDKGVESLIETFGGSDTVRQHIFLNSKTHSVDSVFNFLSHELEL